MRLALATLATLFALAAPARANTQPFGGLTQFPGTLGCVSEDGSGGRCANGVGLAGVTAVTAAPAFDDEAPLLYAASPSQSTLTVFAVDPKHGGLEQTGCFSATARAGCVAVRGLAGASDVAAAQGSPYVVVAARDADAIVVFKRRDRTLVPVPGAAGCAARAIAGCTPARALDQPVAVAAEPGAVFVAARASNAVSRFTVGDGLLAQDGCIEQGNGVADRCSPGRALDAPEDLVLSGDDLYGFHPADRLTVASSASDGVAFLGTGTTAPTQADGSGGCATETGADGCATQTGLRGAARVANAGGEIYVAAPGSGAVTALGGGSVTAPTAAIASPPKPRSVPAAGFTYAGSHVYAGGTGIAPFRREDPTGALSALAAAAFSPAGAVGGLAVSAEWYSLAVYAAVPSAGAVLAFERNIGPQCAGSGFGTPQPVKVTAAAARIPLGCSDPNGDALSYSVATRPRLGRVIGFDGDQALYRGPILDKAPRDDAFTIQVSDGGETALRYVPVELDYVTPGPPPKAIARPAFRILDKRASMDRRGRIRLRVRCTVHSGSRCRAALTLRRGRGVAHKSATLRSGRATRVRVRLAARTRRAVRHARRKGLVVTVSATARDAAGRKATARRRVRVRARR